MLKVEVCSSKTCTTFLKLQSFSGVYLILYLIMSQRVREIIAMNYFIFLPGTLLGPDKWWQPQHCFVLSGCLLWWTSQGSHFVALLNHSYFDKLASLYSFMTIFLETLISVQLCSDFVWKHVIYSEMPPFNHYLCHRSLSLLVTVVPCCIVLFMICNYSFIFVFICNLLSVLQKVPCGQGLFILLSLLHLSHPWW